MTDIDLVQEIRDLQEKFSHCIERRIRKFSDERKQILNEKFPSISNTVEQCFLLLNNEKKENFKCKHCNELTGFHTWKRGYNKFCNLQCTNKFNNQIFNKMKAEAKSLPILTKICVNCGKEYQTKLKKRIACSHSCGAYYRKSVETAEQKAISQTKREITSLERYGDKHHINSEHCRNKTFEKLGVRYPWQSAEILQGIRDRYFEKTGYDNPLKNPEIAEKMKQTRIAKYGSLLAPCYSYKTYVFPSGATAYVQGYEPQALDILLQKYSEEDIVVGRGKITALTGDFKYFSLVTQKEHYYYPDIYVKSINLIIEVKSKYTYELQANTRDLKRGCVEKMGMKFEFMVL